MTARMMVFPFPVEATLKKIAEADIDTLNRLMEILQSKAAAQLSVAELCRVWDLIVRRSQELSAREAAE